MENSILGGSARIIFHIHFFVPNVLKIILGIEVFFLHRGSPLGAPQASPKVSLTHTNHVKAKIVCVTDQILHVAAVIVSHGKNLLV